MLRPGPYSVDRQTESKSDYCSGRPRGDFLTDRGTHFVMRSVWTPSSLRQLLASLFSYSGSQRQRRTRRVACSKRQLRTRKFSRCHGGEAVWKRGLSLASRCHTRPRPGLTSVLCSQQRSSAPGEGAGADELLHLLLQHPHLLLQRGLRITLLSSTRAVRTTR
jgi:hypothetical protein